MSVIMSVSGRLLAIACRALTPAIIGLIMGITPAATRAGVSLEAFGGVAVGGDIRDSTITVGIPPEQIQNLISRRSESEVELRDLGAKLAVTEAAVSGFLHILEQQQVPRELLPAKLAEIALRHKQMVARREALQTADPKVRQLLSKAHTAITEGDYGGAETLLTSMQALRHPGK